MRLIVYFVVLWVIIVSFVLNSCEYVFGNGARETSSSGIAVSGKWYQLNR